MMKIAMLENTTSHRFSIFLRVIICYNYNSCYEPG